MKKLILPILLVTLFSCNKDKNTNTPPPSNPTCDCYEQHQVFNPNYGWMNDYNTDTIKRNCSDDNNSWVWANADHTKRYIINCQ